MSHDYVHTDAFRGATFREADLRGTTFRDCDLTGVKISSSLVDDLTINGFDGRAGRVVIDDVDVTDFVDGELDRRFPERERSEPLLPPRSTARCGLFSTSSGQRPSAGRKNDPSRFDTNA